MLKTKKIGLMLLILIVMVSIQGCNNRVEYEDEEEYIAQTDMEVEDEIEVEEEEEVERTRPGRGPLEPEEPEQPNQEESESEEFVVDEEIISSMQSIARYWFEQFAVADMVDVIDNIIIESLQSGDEVTLLEYVLIAWDFSAISAIYEHPDLVEEAGVDSDLIFSESTSEIRLLFGLGDDHIVDSWIEDINESTTAFVFQLYDIEVPRRSIYMAIAYNDELGLQVFTLEDIEGVSRMTGEFMFCFVEVEYRGSFYSIEGNREAFIDAIYDAMVNLTEPMVSQRRAAGP